ncbi:hypothetical protein XI09_31775 [Bradyrhizobium sp. CCBAU 11386]|nr:hypothetical protein [Bradyrhizobium sp. CCBAU 11386]
MTRWRERAPQYSMRAPDAAQRPSAVRCRAGAHVSESAISGFWVPAQRGNAISAFTRVFDALCALQLVRDTRVSDDDPPCSVIASAAKQSRVFPRRDSGLLRCARNDDVETASSTL